MSGSSGRLHGGSDSLTLLMRSTKSHWQMCPVVADAPTEQKHSHVITFALYRLSGSSGRLHGGADSLTLLMRSTKSHGQMCPVVADACTEGQTV